VIFLFVLVNFTINISILRYNNRNNICKKKKE